VSGISSTTYIGHHKTTVSNNLSLPSLRPFLSLITCRIKDRVQHRLYLQNVYTRIDCQCAAHHCGSPATRSSTLSHFSREEWIATDSTSEVSTDQVGMAEDHTQG
jgi:hypothetical protein